MSINCVSTKKADNQSCADYPPIMGQKKRDDFMLLLQICVTTEI